MACEQSNTVVETTTEKNTLEENLAHFGELITPDGAEDVNSLLASVNNEEELNAKVSGTIVEVCQSKGCWMTLQLDNGETMRVTFKDYGFFVPKDAAGKTVIMDGIAKVDVTDVETLRHYAEDAGKTQEEIDAITEAKKGLSFEASGVIIK
tara:strand:+ start:1018 stop:1470 length:453 start_codon:yes stop_codon:yes gene_type:complete